MFNRPNQTYEYNPDIIKNILGDEANPLNRISELISPGAKVLDIGAGNGLLAWVIREKHGDVIIDGIEPDSYAANLAKKFYRRFYCGLAQDFKDEIFKEDYDFIILADVIEHLNDPLAFLNELCADLPEKTRVILSIPNVAFGTVRISLLNGDFNYVDSGLLEKTHLRFFTLKTIEKLVSNMGMNTEKIYLLQRNIFNTEIDIEKFDLDLYTLLKVMRDELSSTYQFLVVLTKKTVKTEKRCFGEKLKNPLTAFILKKIKKRLMK
ncbi:MAG: class I SAM-dependent methyltransferase [Thermincolia bacterium]